MNITNRGSEPLEFSPAKIEAFADSKPVKVYGVEEYVVLVTRATQSDHLLADARENGKAVQARWSISGAPSMPLMNGKAEAATERLAIKDRHTKGLATAIGMLYPKNVAPGETFGGVIRLQASPLLSAQRLRLRVTVGAETHELNFTVSR